MKRRLFLISICCFVAAQSFGQFIIGLTYGVGGYQWDKSPVGNTTRTSGGIFSEIAGLNLGVGNETIRFILEGYEDYAPFTFSVNEFQGMGTFSAGALAKLSLTPFENWNDERKGFSLGVGTEVTKTEISFKKEEYIRGDWYTTKYAYLAYSWYRESDHTAAQMDVFGKVGIGNHSAMRFEAGIRVSALFVFERN
jgi:hypothetical protein